MLGQKHSDDRAPHLKRAGLTGETRRTVRTLIRQQEATAAKEAALAQEARAKTLSTYIETARKLVPMVALSYGLLISFVYFFVVIGFYPTGLTVGDTLFYVFIAFGHGMMSVFTVLAGVTVITPVMAFDAGAQRAGIRPKTIPGRGAMAFATFVSPMLIAGTALLAEWAFGDEAVSSHLVLILLAITAASLLIGISSHYRAWQLGKSLDSVEGCPIDRNAHQHGTKPDSWGDWLPLGIANGLAFGLLYAGLILVYGTRAIVFLLASVCSGVIAWVVIELIVDEQELREKWRHPERATWLRELKWKPRVAVPATAVIVLLAWLIGFGAKQKIPFLENVKYLNYATFAVASLALAIYTFLIAQAPIGEIQRSPQSNRPPVVDKPLESWGKDTKPWSMLVPLILMAFTVPFIADVAYMDQNMNKSVFRALGVRAENATIRVGQKSLTAIEAVARNAGVDLSVCVEPDGFAEVFPVTVLWHGLGKRSLLGVGLVRNNDEGKPQPVAQLELNSDDVRLLRNQGGQCRDIEQIVHFGSGKTEPVDSYEKDALLKEMAEALNRSFPAPRKDPPDAQYWSLSSVIVTGDADPMPLSEAGNERLAHRRAACLVNAIAPLVLARSNELRQVPEIRWYGEGARTLKKNSCPLEGSRQALMECHAANRMARVRLMFNCRDSNNRTATGCLSPQDGQGKLEAPAASANSSKSGQQTLLEQIAAARAECNGAAP